MLVSPKKNTIQYPTEALSQAIAAEWEGRKSFLPSAMPLTAIAYAAVDMVTPNRDIIMDSLLAYADTDTIVYRSENPDLKNRQEHEWSPVVYWAEHRYDCKFIVTDSVMPIDQSPVTLAIVKRALEAMDDFELSAVVVLTQALSSLLLALAVKEKNLDAEQAFSASLLEERFQQEKWGVDEEAAKRADRLKKDVDASAKFLELLA